MLKLENIKAPQRYIDKLQSAKKIMDTKSDALFIFGGAATAVVSNHFNTASNVGFGDFDIMFNPYVLDERLKTVGDDFLEAYITSITRERFEKSGIEYDFNTGGRGYTWNEGPIVSYKDRTDNVEIVCLTRRDTLTPKIMSEYFNIPFDSFAIDIHGDVYGTTKGLTHLEKGIYEPHNLDETDYFEVRRCFERFSGKLKHYPHLELHIPKDCETPHGMEHLNKYRVHTPNL